jgi:sortase A
VRRTANAAGRVLVTVGTLLLLFVAYQLWGTGIYEARQQSKLQSELKTQISDASESREPVAGTTTTTLPPPPPPEGDGIGLIHIDKIGLDRAVVQGVTVPDLRKGPGHYPDSPMPGQLGNAAIAGHRTTYGAPFNRLDELVPGDDITVTTVSGTFHYTMTRQLVVSPRQTEVLDPTPDATLTLTTCNPKYSARERLVVQARLDVEASPKPSKPAVRQTRSSRETVDDLAGTRESRVPVIWWGLIVALVGGAWWWLFHRTPRWWVWVLGVIPFLAVYAMFCFYLERVLPPGY